MSDYERGLFDRPGVSRRLREAREKAGLTREDLAKTLGVHIRSIDGWENPRQATLPFEHMRLIADVTGARVGWLMQGDEGEEQAMLNLLERVEAAISRFEQGTVVKPARRKAG